MSSGRPLTDADRAPWLVLLRTTAEHTAAEARRGVIMACSALRAGYRDVLRGARARPAQVGLPAHLTPPSAGMLPTFFVYIKSAREVLVERMKKRHGHFMRLDMLDSQLQTLESPESEEGVAVVPLDATTEEQVDSAIQELDKMEVRALL